MDLKTISDPQKTQYNKFITHIVQSWQWGQFREKLGLKVFRYGLFRDGALKATFQLTLHPIPFTKKYYGYLPKGPFPDKNLADALVEIAKDNNCVAIKIEPNILSPTTEKIDSRFKKSPKTLFTKDNFILDLTQSEQQLLKNMHPKTRYNIKVAQKHGVIIKQHQDDEGFQIYQKLYFETTQRQNYHGHSQRYHKLVWETLKDTGTATILIAYYQGEPLAAWMLFKFHDTLYYPYGGSSDKHRNVMATYLLAWEAIKLGKKEKLRSFDLWGALPEDTSPNHPFRGFTKFKEGFGPKRVQYLGTYDLVSNSLIYYPFTLIDKLTPLKVFLLKLLRQ